MLIRALNLALLNFKALLHRLYYDLVRELVILICAAVILATFIYVFQDFINNYVADISTKMRDTFAQVMTLVILLGASLISARMIRSEFDTRRSFKQMAFSSGEASSTIVIYLIIRTILIEICLFGLAWAINVRFLPIWSFCQALLITIPFVAIASASLFLRSKAGNVKTTHFDQFLLSRDLSPVFTMAIWRLLQISRRNRLTKLSLAVGCIFVVMSSISVHYSIPFFVVCFTAFVGGTFASMALAFQLEEDLKAAWTERCMGVSHEQYMRSYHFISAFLAFVIGLPLGLSIVLSQPLSNISLSLVSNALKASFLAGVPLLIMPLLFFQIDGRKPFIQAVLVVLVGLFISTAIFAHWAGLLVLLVFKYYASQSQIGRFYRA